MPAKEFLFCSAVMITATFFVSLCNPIHKNEKRDDNRPYNLTP